MISYAQNFEDVLLQRCFREIESGFYLDIGAGHPIRDSVTYAFYRRGWNGINVDAAKAAFRLLSRFRHRDINVQAFVSDRPGIVTFYDIGLSGLSSSDPTFAAYAAKRGHRVHRTTVEAVTLQALCEKYGVDRIDFLKIDAEGAEKRILSGFDLARWRPKVVLMEAVNPITSAYVNDGVAAIFAGANYTKCYFDGINDYFLADECSDLARHFKVPVNVLDAAIKWADRIPTVFELSKDAAAWRRVFEARLRREWSEMSLEEEVDRECRNANADAPGVKLDAQMISQIYGELLGRSATEDEVSLWMTLYGPKTTGVRDLVSEVLRSEEYALKVLEWGSI